ncbi:MAG: hypothetical protein PHD97_12330 [Bacteroidales bacterium]|nr:hypothetical protein [Bacteroidales bacterium]
MANELNTIDEALQQMPADIEKKSFEATGLRESYKLKKHEYELKASEIIQIEKLKNPDSTQTDLNALSKSGSTKEYIDMILLESKYRRAQAELQRLKDDFDALKERSYNWRAYVKRFG